MFGYGLQSVLTVLVVGVANVTWAVDHSNTLKPVVWNFDRLDRLGDSKASVIGSPRVVTLDGVRAVEFDGAGDGLFLGVHPLAGAKQFTVEVVFRPAPGGLPEQRFFHMQEHTSDDRVMFETRLVGKDKWFLDTFVKSGDQERTLYAETFLHPLGPWYHAALVVDGRQMRHYVGGQLELTTDLDYRSQGPGRTSFGVRLNKVYWYCGAISQARFTHRALKPNEFTIPDE